MLPLMTRASGSTLNGLTRSLKLAPLRRAVEVPREPSRTAALAEAPRRLRSLAGFSTMPSLACWGIPLPLRTHRRRPDEPAASDRRPNLPELHRVGSRPLPSWFNSRLFPATLTAMETVLAAAGISPGKEIAGLDQLTLRNTKPADIVMWYPEPQYRSGASDADFMHRLTAGAQFATAAMVGKSPRSAGYVHVFMITRDFTGVNEGAASPEELAKNAVFEIVGDMTGKRNTIGTTYRPAPFMMVFRSTDEALAGRAAEIARNWQHKLSNVPFDMYAAGLSVLRSESFTDQARQRAERYGANPLSPDPDLLASGNFCVSAPLAIYQAAAVSQGRELSGALRVDATRVSPRDLHHLLLQDPAFKLVGYLADEPASDKES